MEKVATWRRLALIVVAIASAQAWAMRREHADSWMMWGTLLAAYALLSAWSVSVLRSTPDAPRIAPKSGDVTLGVVIGLVMTVGGFLFLRWWTDAPSGHHAWLFQIYARTGQVQGVPLRVSALLGLAVMEELVWRGHVLTLLRGSTGARFAPPLSALLYAGSHLPTVWLLADPHAGPNPLLVLAALGGGLVWGYTAFALNRLVPVIIAHGVFSYFLSGPPPTWM